MVPALPQAGPASASRSKALPFPAPIRISADQARSTPPAAPEARRPPVPLLFASRPPVVLPEIQAQPQAQPQAQAAPDPAGEAAAKAVIEADGYKRVRALTKTADGWRARALRGTTEVGLRVDAAGNVMAD